jgi:hypothetical protein
VAECIWVLRLDGSGLRRLLIEDCVLKIPIYRLGLATRVAFPDREYGLSSEGWWFLARPRIATENEACEVTPSQVKDDLERCHIQIPPELMSVESNTEVNVAPKLRDRQELILAVFSEHGSGPFKGKKIAELGQLDYDSHLRADLSELKRLGYLAHDGRGYLRTDKPYRCP